ncbi:methylenetetrahydrofolate reductase [Campylobacter sp.]|uniref:methylenetetrahydrofolate reductase n=1 Tax=Campylobacter sp. TaxID=205 RepID=UPI0026F92213|nr:methylenetetrahydrofolate reductase [Campylobacter sp.]
MLKEKILNREDGILLYALTPPKAAFEESKLRDIANRWSDRINSIPAEGLALYDIQDESSRTNDERTFEFSDTLSPEVYYKDYLNVGVPSVFYSVVGKYRESEFRSNLISNSSNLHVFVGAASSRAKTNLGLDKAYEIARDEFEDLITGGICIAERHFKNGSEHERMAQKIALGAKFFISQAVYDVKMAENLLQDVARANLKAPIIFTFSTCGTQKTLEFIKWLGISIPHLVEKRLAQSDDMLKTSTEICVENFSKLSKIANNLGVSIGANIESVMAKRAEIEASLELTHKIKAFI